MQFGCECYKICKLLVAYHGSHSVGSKGVERREGIKFVSKKFLLLPASELVLPHHLYVHVLSVFRKFETTLLLVSCVC